MVHDLEDLAVLVAVDLLFLENLLGAIDGAVLDEDGPENGALGLDAVRHVLVERDIAGHVVCLRKRGAAIVTLCCAAFRGFVKITPGRSETDGRCPDFRSGERKVRTPQGIALGNTQSRRREGKCHRKQTAGAGSSASVPVRVKRWGKSPPVPRVTGAARQTPQGARPNRGAFAGGPPVSSRVGRLALGPADGGVRDLRGAGARFRRVREAARAGNRAGRGMTIGRSFRRRQDSAYGSLRPILPRPRAAPAGPTHAGLRMTRALRARLERELVRLRPAIERLSRGLHQRAELSLEESESAGLLIRFLEQEGFAIKRRVAGLPTSFVARRKLGHGGPRVALLAEYDA